MSKIKRQLLFKDFFIDTFDSTLNDKNPRTGMALADGKDWNFSYDNIGQVIGAMLNNSGSLLNTYSYNYDLIGNRTQTAKDNDITSYSSNIVNQYTQINSAVPTYDQDGNMLTNGSWSYTWNGENRMTVAQNAARKVEFSYDYMGRCFERKEYTASNGSWNLDKTVYIVYDDYKQIAEYVNEELHQQYAWDSAGLDTVAFMSKSNSVYMYWTDGNKNVLKLFDTAGEQASYSYDPFGKVTTAEGSLAADNPFRFSSEYHNDITGLVEYIYRKYDPSLGRWINRDPVEEQGGVNLYVITSNCLIDYIDKLGLRKMCGKDITSWLVNAMYTNGKIAENSLFVKYSNMMLSPRTTFSTPNALPGLFVTHLLRFKNLVKTGAPWDFKRNLLNMNSQDKNTHKDCRKAVTLCGQCIQYETISNIHYGYIVMKAGIGRFLGEYGAGVAQIKDHENKTWISAAIEALRRENFGDEFEDNIAVKIGYEYYETGDLCGVLNQYKDNLKQNNKSCCPQKISGIPPKIKNVSKW